MILRAINIVNLHLSRLGFSGASAGYKTTMTQIKGLGFLLVVKLVKVYELTLLIAPHPSHPHQSLSSYLRLLITTISTNCTTLAICVLLMPMLDRTSVLAVNCINTPLNWFSGISMTIWHAPCKLTPIPQIPI